MSLRLPSGLTNKILAKHFDKDISELFDMNFLQKLAKQNIIKLNSGQIKICKNYYLITNEIIRKISNHITI